MYQPEINNNVNIVVPPGVIKTETPKSSVQQPMLPPCRICGEKASGFHYGVNTCEACKGFFRRCLLKTMSDECTNEGKCNANSGKRNMCASCRYKTCIRVGMSKSAIKTGRYTHEKKTSNIREVKLLEAKASSSNSPNSMLTNALINSSVLLTPESMKSSEPMDIDEGSAKFHYNAQVEHIARNDKYEEVIETILTAYKEQTMHTMDFFSSLKEKEQEYLKEKKLYTEVFGSMKPVTAEEYIKIYQATGLDIDGRRELIQSMIPRIENGMRRCIMFIKQLPGFRLLPVDDQISLIKMSRVEMGILIGHRLLNVKDRLFTFFWGETVAAEDLMRIHSSDTVDDMFSFAERMQALQLTLVETILLSSIAIFAVDNVSREGRECCSTHQRNLIKVLLYAITTNYQPKIDIFNGFYASGLDYSSEPSLRLSDLLMLLPQVRTLFNRLASEKSQFFTTYSDIFQFPPMFYELWNTERKN